ncbi:hypothetical protein HA466_0178790 [Hirschfeldia incana]|nr:hypothetical protein HA466_0178790 [Hirschfeldia incana]
MLHRKIFYSSARSFTTEGQLPSLVHKRDLDILHDPWFPLGTAFTVTERDRLFPSRIIDSEHQIQRFMKIGIDHILMYYKVGMIVVTDESQIMGLGDLGNRDP